MFDLARLADMAAGVLGQSATEIDTSAIMEQLAENGIDPSQLQDLGSEQLLSMLSENGIDLSELNPDQLNTLADNFGVTEQLPEWLSQFTDRAA